MTSTRKSVNKYYTIKLASEKKVLRPELYDNWKIDIQSWINQVWERSKR